MRTKNIIVGMLMLFIIAACSSVEKITEQSYTPPSVKIQPRLLYPKYAQENGYTGIAKAIVSISKTGEVEKVQVYKSSGYDILDKAAEDYCKQLTFNPAIRNGNNVSAKITWQIDFNISDYNMDANSYMFQIQKLYGSYARTSDAAEKKHLESEILARHNQFVMDMKDALSFNYVLGKVVSSEIFDEWKNKWDSWPLSFLIYHDFMQRFNDYDSLLVVKSLMIKALQFDLEYIENSTDHNLRSQNGKERIINFIKNFVKKNYPDINLDDKKISMHVES
jgi:TonB family protein